MNLSLEQHLAVTNTTIAYTDSLREDIRILEEELLDIDVTDNETKNYFSRLEELIVSRKVAYGQAMNRVVELGSEHLIPSEADAS